MQLPTSIEPETSGEETTFYRHRMRPKWGLAILAWDTGDKRGFQFEDGQVRIIKDGFYDLMIEVEPQDLDREEMARVLQRKLTVAVAREERKEEASERGRPLLQLEDQLRIFLHLYPGGFQDERWCKDVRGEGAERRLKKLRVPALQQARQLLGPDVLPGLMNEDRYGDIVGRALDILDATDLVAPADFRSMRDTAADHAAELAPALADLLAGGEDAAVLIQRWLSALQATLGQAPSWRLATCLPALIDPQANVCVRASIFREQARWMAPTLTFPREPDPDAWIRLGDMALRIRDRLTEAGHTPRDLVDVHDFSWTTLRPAAKKVLATLDA